MEAIALVGGLEVGGIVVKDPEVVQEDKSKAYNSNSAVVILIFIEAPPFMLL